MSSYKRLDCYLGSFGPQALHLNATVCVMRANTNNKATVLINDSNMSIIRSSGIPVIQGGSNVLKSMEKQLGLSEFLVVSWVSAVEGCPSSRVPLCIDTD